jgi:hypothetical protein
MKISYIKDKHFLGLSNLIGKPLSSIQYIEWNDLIEPSSPIAFEFEHDWLEVSTDNYNSLNLTWSELNFNSLPRRYTNGENLKWVKDKLVTSVDITHSKKESEYSKSIIGKKLRSIELISDEIEDFVSIILIFDESVLTIENRDEIFIKNKLPPFYEQQKSNRIQIL